MSSKAKILCVGNMVFCDAFCVLAQTGSAEVLRAVTVAEARRHFTDTPDLFAIFLSDCVEQEMDTLELVVEIRRGSPVLMHAYCVRPEIARRFDNAGCHSTVSNWHQVNELVQDLISCFC
jgi:CheY-like chemotaxis protein